MGIRSLLRNAFGRSRTARKDRTDSGEGTVPEAQSADASVTTAPDMAAPGAAADETAPADTSAAPAESSASESTSGAETPSSASSGEADALLAAFDAAAEEPAAKPEAETAEADETPNVPEVTAAAEEPADNTPSTTAPTATEPQRTIPAQAGAPEVERTDSTAVPPQAASADSAPEKTPTSPATPESDPAAEEPTPVSGEATAPESADEDAQPEATEGKSASIPAQRTPAEDHAGARVPAQRTAPPSEPKTAEPKAEPAEPAAADSSGAPAISLTKIEESAPGLVNLYKKAGDALGAGRLGGRRAAVYLVLDRSGSMRRYYKDGTVQHLAEQALALSAHLDDDGTVPVVFFSTDIDGIADVSLDGYEGRIEALHADLGHMGRTNYHRAIEAVIEHYTKSGSTDPAFVIFQTDGAPTSKIAAEKALCEAAKLPIFWQFIGFGEPEAKGFDFLRKLDVLSVPEKRPVDNAGFFHAGLDPLLVADDELYTKLMAEFPAWLESARNAGILR